MRIIFLDVDGVLNSRQSALNGTSHDPETGSVYGLCPTLVAKLTRLIEDTKALVVLSSTWRMNWKDVQKVVGAGIPIIGLTPQGGRTKAGLHLGYARRHEIQTWLDLPAHDRYADFRTPPEIWDAEVEDFVIIDDDSDANIEGHFYKTDFETGLTGSICDAIRARWADSIDTTPGGE